MKLCTKCGETKPLDDFHRERQQPDGRNRQCKACRSNYMREQAFKKWQREIQRTQSTETQHELLCHSETS